MRPKTAHFCSFLASKLMILHKKTRFWLKKRLMAPLILQRYMPPCAEWKNEWCRGSSVLEVLPPGCNSNGSIPLICAMPSWLSMWGNTVALVPCARIHVCLLPYCKGTKKWAEYQILAQKSVVFHTEINYYSHRNHRKHRNFSAYTADGSWNPKILRILNGSAEMVEKPEIVLFG